MQRKCSKQAQFSHIFRRETKQVKHRKLFRDYFVFDDGRIIKQERVSHM